DVQTCALQISHTHTHTHTHPSPRMTSAASQQRTVPGSKEDECVQDCVCFVLHYTCLGFYLRCSVCVCVCVCVCVHVSHSQSRWMITLSSFWTETRLFGKVPGNYNLCFTYSVGVGAVEL